MPPKLVDPYHLQTLIIGHSARSRKAILKSNGQLTCCRGFVWNGPSGPAVDTANTMGPSCGHDALYSLIEDGKLSDSARRRADKSYRRWLKSAGVSWWRRMLHFKGVRWFGWLHV
jgi:hypothetical protein